MGHLIRYFMQFRKFIGKRIYYLFFFILVIGFFEGIGISLFLPILQNGFGEDRLSTALKIVFNFFSMPFSFNKFLILTFAFFVLRSVFLISYARYFSKLSSKLIASLRQRVTDSVFDANYTYLVRKEAGYINNVIIREITHVVRAFATFSQTISFALYGIVYAALSLLLNFKAAIIVLACGPIIFLFMKRLNRLTTKASRNLSSSYGRFQSFMIQGLSKFKYLKATFTYRKFAGLIENENRKLGKLHFKLSFLQALSRDAFEPVVVLVVIGLMFYHVSVLKKGIDEVIFLIFLFPQIARQFLNTQINYRKFLGTIGSIETFHGLEKELEE